MKLNYAKMQNEHEELQKQAALLKNRCHQLENERLPLIAQLEYADRNLREVKKQQQQQQATMNTSTTVHHQLAPPLQSIENSNKQSMTRLIRSPSLDMRVMRRTSETIFASQTLLDRQFALSDDKMFSMDDTRPLDHDDLALLHHKHHYALTGRSTDMLTKYSIENEEEPIHLDLGPMDHHRRLTELQRRNLSQTETFTHGLSIGNDGSRFRRVFG